MRRVAAVVAVAALALTAAARADTPIIDVSEADLENGEEVYEPCAACHGPYGQGGGGGVYPRLAGLSATYLAKELRLFKSRLRENIPMIPYATERELPEQDVIDVSAYLSTIELPTRLPPVDAPMDGYERLLQAKKVLNIPRAEGDVAAGAAAYKTLCAECHGDDGVGSEARTPRLAGQYTGYLYNQIQNYIEMEREHRDTDIVFEDPGDRVLRDILAYISTLDD